MIPTNGFFVITKKPDIEALDFVLPIGEAFKYSEGASPATLSSEFEDYIGFEIDGGEIHLGVGEAETGVGSQVRLIPTKVGSVILLDAYLMPTALGVLLSEGCPDTTVVSYIEGDGQLISVGNEIGTNPIFDEETPLDMVLSE